MVIFLTEFTQLYLTPKISLMGSSLAFSLEEDPVRCAKVCDKSWVILTWVPFLWVLFLLFELKNLTTSEFWSGICFWMNEKNEWWRHATEKHEKCRVLTSNNLCLYKVVPQMGSPQIDWHIYRFTPLHYTKYFYLHELTQ